LLPLSFRSAFKNYKYLSSFSPSPRFPNLPKSSFFSNSSTNTAAMATITIDPNYGYVLLAAASTFILNTWHSLNTGNYRKAAKIPYPAAYAPPSRTDEDAHKFNCAQRAHANFIENQPTMLGALLLAGLKFPITSAILGVAWTVSRYLYMVG
jgi:glutathione S-transferase